MSFYHFVVVLCVVVVVVVEELVTVNWFATVTLFGTSCL